MNLSSDDIQRYCETNSTQPTLLLQRIERETNLKTTQPNMISGHILGQFYSEMVRMIKPMHVLEIGTFTGYSTISIADALPEKAVITTIEVNKETHYLANTFFADFEHPEKINSLLGDAAEVIPALTKQWDLVLIDAGKKDNALYYEMVLDKLAVNGYIIVDNVIWKGKTMHSKMDKVTKLIDDFNLMISQDSRVQQLMLPIRDGITIIRKVR